MCPSRSDFCRIVVYKGKVHTHAENYKHSPPKKILPKDSFLFWWVRNYFAFFIHKAFVSGLNRGANLLIPFASFQVPSRGPPSKEKQTTKVNSGFITLKPWNCSSNSFLNRKILPEVF